MKERFYVKHWKPIVFGTVLAAIAAGAAIAAAPSFGPTKKEHWGVIPRNTIGSPVGDLRFGPASVTPPNGDLSEPPYGNGSLGLEVANNSTTLSPPAEKIAFGNEVDFFGDNVLDINAVGYHVFQTGENNNPSQGQGGSPTNLPNITFEIDPNLTASPSNFSSMVWVPGPFASPVNQWSPYIDATTNGMWYLTGNAGTVSGCNQGTMCSFAALMTALNDGGTSAEPVVLSFAVAKGRDNLWVGAVDGLRLNDKIYDFEANEVKERGAPH